MRIGLDFDNTLACYDHLFVEIAKKEGMLPEMWQGSKQEVRDFLREQVNGEETWQILQGQVYGKWMHRAQLKPAAAWFLYRCRARQLSVVIVSHKTRFSSKDPEQIPLREVALSWMEDQEFFKSNVFGLKHDDIFFESTRVEKVQRIESLKCHYFVDDLLEVFQETEFPQGVRKILYASADAAERLPADVKSCVDWTAVASELLGPDTEKEVLYVARKIAPDRSIVSCVSEGSGANSRVYRVYQKNEPPLALKRYPYFDSDQRNRLTVEYVACQFLRSQGIDSVPLAINKDEKIQVGLFEWIFGNSVVKPTDCDLHQAVSFVRIVDSARLLDGARDLPKASEACLSGEEICRQIIVRRRRLGEVAVSDPQLKTHLIESFDPLWEKTRRWAEQCWPEGVEFCENLPIASQTLSLSDFGFHNALREKSGVIRFLDLEYFGWDDPVKLASDFWWHPGMALGKLMKAAWMDAITEIFSRDSHFLMRLNAAHPLYGLRWAMIVLNGFLRTENIQLWPAEIRQAQLNKSIVYCNKVNDWVTNDRRIN
jgi:hypothetical protein